MYNDRVHNYCCAVRAFIWCLLVLQYFGCSNICLLTSSVSVFVVGILMESFVTAKNISHSHWEGMWQLCARL